MTPHAAKPGTEHLNEPVLSFARRDFATLSMDLTVEEALTAIRHHGVGEKVIYFYVVDEAQRLAGVVPTRRLLVSGLDQRLDTLMIRNVIAIPDTATVLDVCEFFTLYKFLAFPIVDAQHRLVAIVDVSLFTDEVFDIAERAEREQMEGVFEAIGFRVSQVRNASSLRAFRFRFPWLLTTIASGAFCALLAGAFKATLAQSLVIAFFLTMILGLGESVSMQSMTVTIQALRNQKPSLSWYFITLRREFLTAIFLGAACGILAGLIVYFWQHDEVAAFVIGVSVAFCLCAACVTGLSVPTLLHALKLDPKIAAGPITLALADIFTLLFYFSLAKYFLNR
ncbi:MAG TPA: magnesium transporter [Candidatus Sulfotelmatobacter sp.]|nr:magnesium transporter [Candidatus Sulfotelmatobacter sp.]